MNQIYHYCQISRQAHFKAVAHLQAGLDRVPLYEALIDQVRGHSSWDEFAQDL